MLAVEVCARPPLAMQALGYFDTLWSNRAALGIEYTADFAAFADPRQADYWLYRVLEATGISASEASASGCARTAPACCASAASAALRRLLERRHDLAHAVGGCRWPRLPPRSLPTTSRPSRRPRMQSSTTCTSGAPPPPRVVRLEAPQRDLQQVSPLGKGLPESCTELHSPEARSVSTASASTIAGRRRRPAAAGVEAHAVVRLHQHDVRAVESGAGARAPAARRTRRSATPAAAPRCWRRSGARR